MRAHGEDTYCGKCGRMFEAHEWTGPCPRCGWDGDDKPADVVFNQELIEDNR